MKIVGLDFETYYDKEYSLRKMTPVEYVLDPRFEMIGCSVKDPGEKPYWVEGPDFPKYIAQADKSAAYLSHNMLFDGCILSYRHNFRPKLLVCTMSIARACLGHVLRSVALKSVALHLGLGVKGETVHNVIGMNLATIKSLPALYTSYQDYSNNDNELAMGIFDHFVRETRQFPISELAVMDMVLRCCLQPRFQLDQMVLAEHLNQVKADKAQLLAQAGLQYDASGKVPDLMSNDKFAALLQQVGCDPPTKLSLKTNQQTWAFAKSDPQFIELADHENPLVQTLVGARLGHKSTLEETRTERLIKVSRLWWPEQGTAAWMPIPLRFSAAHTHRLGGDWKLNLQNLPRNTPAKASQLRRALSAPPGHKVVQGDASQIEARLVAWLSGQQELIAAFTNGEDVYASFAESVFEKPINKHEHPTERFVGKTSILGLGFNAGWPKFQATIKIQSLAQTGKLVVLTDEEAQKVVHTYRVVKYPEIPAAWKELNNRGIACLAGGAPYTFGPCVFEAGAILLPNGLKLKYHDLQHDEEGWSYVYGGKRKRIYGGKLMENIAQALARILTMEAGVRVQKRIHEADLWLNLQAHDELAYVVPDKLVDVVKAIIKQEMEKVPAWAAGLPLAAEVGSGQNYGEAK